MVIDPRGKRFVMNMQLSVLPEPSLSDWQ